MKQKFFRGQRVGLAKKFPQMMDHFDGKGCEAIVMASYSDLYGFGDFSNFNLLILPKRGKPFSSSWYPEGLLTLISNNRESGEEIIQRYKEYEAEHPDGDET